MSMYKYSVLKIQWLLKFKIRLNRLNRTVHVSHALLWATNRPYWNAKIRFGYK